MFALGQKQTFATQNGMSALPPIATSIAFFGMSALAKSGYLLCRADTMQRNVRFAPLVDAFPSEFVRRVLDRIEDFLTYGKTNGAAKAIIPCMLRVQRQGSRGDINFCTVLVGRLSPAALRPKAQVSSSLSMRRCRFRIEVKPSSARVRAVRACLRANKVCR